MTAAEASATRRRSVLNRLLDLPFIPSFVLRRKPNLRVTEQAGAEVECHVA
ncbi:hypothetical protein ABZ892_24060 [Streptomyces sp. NPDC046924]|uniref:hypothetical protein n=1 Tax=Streptomyces sp. NPDC046924 TaxID=3155136 RepID=UPI0033CE5959